MTKLTLREEATAKFLAKADEALVALFTPEYTEYDGKREQKNPFLQLTPGERNDIILEACSLLIAQISAKIMVMYPDMDQVGATASISRRIADYTEAYQKKFLAEKEANERLNTSK